MIIHVIKSDEIINTFLMIHEYVKSNYWFIAVGMEIPNESICSMMIIHVIKSDESVSMHS